MSRCQVVLADTRADIGAPASDGNRRADVRAGERLPLGIREPLEPVGVDLRPGPSGATFIPSPPSSPWP